MTERTETLQQNSAGMAGLEVLFDFDPISLTEMDEVKMMNRFDSKFVFTKAFLPKILDAIQNDYYVLKTEGTRIQLYNTVYFDTTDDHFYLAHHNGRSNRLKLRKREYADSGRVFLEIKTKTNKGLSTKSRMEILGFENYLTKEEAVFVGQHSSVETETLEAKFGSRFHRITLVSKNLDERCTFDLNIQLNSFLSGESELKDLVIAEVKREKQFSKSKLVQVFKEYKIRSQSFSKYCFGRALNEDDLKSNIFKAGIQQIKNQIKS